MNYSFRQEEKKTRCFRRAETIAVQRTSYGLGSVCQLNRYWPAFILNAKLAECIEAAVFVPTGDLHSLS
jgi:hypothetical protein